MLPDPWEAASRWGLALITHLSISETPADPESIRQLRKLEAQARFETGMEFEQWITLTKEKQQSILRDTQQAIRNANQNLLIIQHSGQQAEKTGDEH